MAQSEESKTAAVPSAQLLPLLVQANRAQVLASMSREAAHDLKGPIQALFLFDFEDRSAEMESVFHMAVNKMAETIDRVTRIALPRTNGRQSGPFTIDELLGVTREMYLCQRNLPAAELVIDAPASLPPVMGNDWDWQQVLINLLMNAREAAGEGPGAKITISARESSQGVELAVRDTGPGVPASQRDWIFQPLTTTHSSDEVRGLGLPVARWLAERNGGSVQLVSSDGPACFVATLRALTRN